MDVTHGMHFVVYTYKSHFSVARRQTMGLETWTFIVLHVAVATKSSARQYWHSQSALCVAALISAHFFLVHFLRAAEQSVLYLLYACAHIWGYFCDLRIIMWANHKNVHLFYFFILTAQKIFIANNELIGVTERAIKCDNIYIMLPLCTLVCDRHWHYYGPSGRVSARDEDEDEEFVIVVIAIKPTSLLPLTPWSSKITIVVVVFVVAVVIADIAHCFFVHGPRFSSRTIHKEVESFRKFEVVQWMNVNLKQNNYASHIRFGNQINESSAHTYITPYASAHVWMLLNRSEYGRFVLFVHI